MKDFVERPVEGIEGGYCAKCDTLKPIKDFKRLLTFAETKRRGYVGNHRVEVLEFVCKACQPKGVSPSKMSTKQIHNAVEAGDMSLLKAEELLTRRDMLATEGKRRGAYSRWAKARTKRWAPLIFQLNKDMAVLHQQEKNGRINGNPAIVAYASRYKEVLNNIRYRMRKDCDVLELEPPEDWRTLIKPHEMDEIKAAWQAIPNRHRMKIPALLNPHYVPPAYKEDGTAVGDLTVKTRNLEGERLLRERIEYMDEVRAKKEAERAARIAQGEDVPPLPPPPDRKVVAPRLVTQREREERARVAAAADDLLAELGINPNQE
jgi:hypothetical protein